MAIETAIQNAIDQVERDHDVRVLFACESGSRAWGFASQDSDYDVRFLYVHKRDWYMSIMPGRDVIERMLPEDLDVSGWGLRKALVLLRKSNPPLLEWLRSPIVYRQDETFMREFSELAEFCYSPERCFYHYRSMAEGNIRNYFDEDLVPLKKYLYVLRPILACLWIERGLGPAPMEFGEMVERVVDDSVLREEIDALLAAKMAGGEMGKGPKLPAIQAFVDSQRSRLGKVKWLASKIVPVEPLDAFFRRTVG